MPANLDAVFQTVDDGRSLGRVLRPRRGPAGEQEQRGQAAKSSSSARQRTLRELARVVGCDIADVHALDALWQSCAIDPCRIRPPTGYSLTRRWSSRLARMIIGAGLIVVGIIALAAPFAIGTWSLQFLGLPMFAVGAVELYTTIASPELRVRPSALCDRLSCDHRRPCSLSQPVSGRLGRRRTAPRAARHRRRAEDRPGRRRPRHRIANRDRPQRRIEPAACAHRLVAVAKGRSRNRDRRRGCRIHLGGRLAPAPRAHSGARGHPARRRTQDSIPTQSSASESMSCSPRRTRHAPRAPPSSRRPNCTGLRSPQSCCSSPIWGACDRATHGSV